MLNFALITFNICTALLVFKFKLFKWNIGCSHDVAHTDSPHYYFSGYHPCLELIGDLSTLRFIAVYVGCVLEEVYYQ